ncbi:hypothetical protein Ac2012v2_001112 [Leucoagaricus gongylophorus]
MPVTPINSFDEFKTIINSGQPVVIDFWADWCGPCRMISPFFEELSDNTEGVKFCKVDVDAQLEIAQECGIQAMPTFMLFKDGEKRSEFRGALKPKLEELIVSSKSLV